MEPLQALDLLFRGMAIGAQLGLGIALARGAAQYDLRIATLLFIVSNICFTINGSPPLQPIMAPVEFVLWLVQIGGAGYFWLFAVTLFEDRRLTPASSVPAAALTLIGLAGHFGPDAASPAIWTVHNVFGLLLACHALIVIVRSGRNDLVEARRRLRVPFLVLIAVFSMLLSVAQIGQIMGIDANWYEFANALVQALLGVGGVVVLLEARPALFGVAGTDQASRNDPRPSADSLFWLDRLRSAMEHDELWRREGLTIASLASDIGLPEHRLRRLINDELGHRNFATYVNQHRIAAAKRILSDPAAGARSVASIAFDLGFGSLGPFNRAFRDATEITPTQYRRENIGLGLADS